MEQDKLRATLVKHLYLLQRNLEAAPLEVLQTKYKKPFGELRHAISTTATAYTKQLAMQDIFIRQKYLAEAKPYIDKVVQQTSKLREISAAAFDRQSIDEIDSLALDLREEFLAALQPFFADHMCLYLTAECYAYPPKLPEIYNDATASVWRDGKWQRMEDTSAGTLLRMSEPQKLAA